MNRENDPLNLKPANDPRGPNVNKVERASNSYKNAQSADGLNANGGKNQTTGLSEPFVTTVKFSQEKK